MHAGLSGVVESEGIRLALALFPGPALTLTPALALIPTPTQTLSRLVGLRPKAIFLYGAEIEYILNKVIIKSLLGD